MELHAASSIGHICGELLVGIKTGESYGESSRLSGPHKTWNWYLHAMQDMKNMV